MAAVCFVASATGRRAKVSKNSATSSITYASSKRIVQVAFWSVKRGSNAKPSRAVQVARNASDLVIIDAKQFAKGPVARVELPCRVPYGFHGSWIGD